MPGQIPAEGPVVAAAGTALKPSERSSARAAAAAAAEEAVAAAQSAKAPESEGCNLLVVATTESV